MLGGAAVTDGIRASAREMLARAARRQARGDKAKAKGRKAKAKARTAKGAERKDTAMARKYLIETFGCQMNVHDSERMAGLLEQAGFEATDDAADADVVVINTCSVRERAEDKLYTRLGELRADGRRAGPRSDRRGRRLRGAAGRRARSSSARPASPTSSSARRRSAACRCSSSRRPRDARRPLVDLDPYDDVTFPLGVTRRGDPVKAYVTIIEGCNEFCSFCVVPYTRGHERMRPKADILAEVREAAASGPPGSAAARPDRQPLRRARRSVVRLHRAARGDSRGRRASSGSASRARIRGTSRRGSSSAMARLPKICRHLHLPVQSGSTRCSTAMRRRYTRESYLDLVARIRAALPDVALSTDMIVGFPGETDADFEETLSLTAAVAVPQHVLVQVLAAAEHARREAAARRRAARRRRRGGSWRCRRCSATIQTALNDALVGQDGRRARRRGEPAARHGALGPDEHRTWSSTCRGRRTGSAGRCRCASSARGRTASGASD